MPLLNPAAARADAAAAPSGRSWLAQARADFHAACLAGPISITRGLPSIADVANGPSRAIATALVARIGAGHLQAEKPAGQTAGAMFEQACQAFLERCLAQLAPLCPGLSVARGRAITQFAQYAHLQELRALAEASRALKTHLGSDYLIKPDIVIARAPLDGGALRALGLDPGAPEGRLSALHGDGERPILHGSISCKLTIRSDRVQNTRSEALNLIRNRKGPLPHIAAVTAEPTPSRIAAIALGTGDIDCVYHFALPELLAVLQEQGREQRELVETMIEGRRLRDIADLPLDLML